MNIVRYTKLGVVSAISLGALFGVANVGVGLNNVAHAEADGSSIQVLPPYEDAYKSVANGYYALHIAPKITDSSGATYDLGGGVYTVKQVEQYKPNGDAEEVDGASIDLALAPPFSPNRVVVSEDGTYTVQNTVRVPGYLLDTETYQYTFPNGEINQQNQIYEVVPKLTPAMDEFTFTKTSEDDKTPLQGVEFKVYKTRDEALQLDYGEGEEFVKTITTGTDGTVKTGDLPEGQYYLVETGTVDGHALDTSKIYFEIGVNSNGTTTFAREIDAKSDLVNTSDHFLNYILPTIDKKVDTDMSEGLQFADETQNTSYNGLISYDFNLVVPKDLGRYVKFSFTDTFDERLDGQEIAGTTKFTSNDTNAPLELNTDYTVDVNGNVATFNFTKSGRERLAEGNIKYSYQTHILDNSEVKTEDLLNNTIVMSYDNGLGAFGEVTDSVDVELKEGVLQINKEDGRESGTLLEGANFKLYEKDTSGVVGSTDVGSALYEYNGEVYKEVRNPQTNDLYEGTTDDTGKVVFKDIPFGTYYAFETKAPDGYNLNNTPLEVTIQDTTTTVDGIEDGVILSVDNYKRTDNLPATGTIGLMFIGGLTVASALGAIATKRKLKEDEDLEETTVK